MSVQWNPSNKAIDWPILAQSKPWEDDHRDGNPILMMLSAFALLSVGGAVLYGIWMIPYRLILENIVWFWNSGGDSPWNGPARWWIVTGIACVLWFCGVGLVEWWRKDRP